ncbi:hypothetical protein LCGC14_2092070 [marine sediment metagenome]|uniref:Uncharacterized protein n=1 Tax=marine sediment metagenome TaxID=412755 RepID=A0A0F9ECB5_9ZZZZ
MITHTIQLSIVVGGGWGGVAGVVGVVGGMAGTVSLILECCRLTVIGV